MEALLRPTDLPKRSDDPILGDIIEFWQGNPGALSPGRAVLLGVRCDQGVIRNGGRAGALEAPQHIRNWLFRMVPWDPETDVDLTKNPPLDIGNLKMLDTVEENQQALGLVVAALLERETVPVIMGGGHEIAYGHFLGYAASQRKVGILNIDAHLDVRPMDGAKGHSGSPFRQAFEHAMAPLPGSHYSCIGAQPGCVGRPHWQFVHGRGGVVRWCGEPPGSIEQQFLEERSRLAGLGCQIYVSLDADVVCAADVPGVSAPNPVGHTGKELLVVARAAGQSPEVSSFDLVEINPKVDREALSVRWGAHAIWNFLIGHGTRPAPEPPTVATTNVTIATSKSAPR